VIARSERWPRRALEVRRAGAAVALGIVLFLASFGLLHVGPFDDNEIIDTPVYQRYGDAVLDGLVPYRDFSLEYPPGALPAFILPSLAPADDYRTVFELTMLACGLAAVALVAIALASSGAGPGRLYGATALAALAPLALGPVVLTRYDLWPAALTIGALAAILADRDRLGFGLLGLAVAAKVYPVVLVPIALVYVARRRGGRDAAIAFGVFALVLAAVLAPFAVSSSGGLAESLERQVSRPLQVESLGAAFLLAAHQADGGYMPSVVSSFGSQNLVGAAPDALAALLAALQALAVVAVWLVFVTRRGSRAELGAAAAAAVAAFVAFGKVLSPQFLIWLIPLVPLAAGRRGLAASGLFLVALVLTQLWFPSQYWELVALEAAPTWLLLARDVVLVALAATLLAATAREPERSRSV
jgi:Glycosyltransferase family 87